MLKPVRTSPPATAIISAADLKAHSDITFDTDDALIADCITDATAYLDGYSGILGRCLITQTWRQDFEDWAKCLRLPFPDMQSVVVKYFDENNAEQTVDSGLYELLEDGLGSFVKFTGSFTAPSLYDDRTDAINVTMVVGYRDAATDIPGGILRAAKMLAALWYEQRETGSETTISEVPYGLQMMIQPYRRVLP